MALSERLILYECGCQIKGPLWIVACKYHKKWQFYPYCFELKTIMACIVLGKIPEELNAYEDQLVITVGYARDAQYDEIRNPLDYFEKQTIKYLNSVYYSQIPISESLIDNPQIKITKEQVDDLNDIIDKEIKAFYTPKCKHKFHTDYYMGVKTECPWCGESWRE